MKKQETGLGKYIYMEWLPYPAANLPDEAFLSQARLNQQIY